LLALPSQMIKKKPICNYICHTFCTIREKHISCLMMRQGNLWWFKTFAVMHMLEPELCTMTQVTGRKKKSFHTSQFKDTRKIIYIKHWIHKPFTYLNDFLQWPLNLSISNIYLSRTWYGSTTSWSFPSIHMEYLTLGKSLCNKSFGTCP